VRTFVATKNRGKLAELLAIFADSPFALETYDAYRDPVEGETSYVENAALKADALRAQLREAGIAAAVLADDSGLEIAALGGRPGVLSARYGGADATWSERRRALLAETDATGAADRSARFVSAIHVVLPDGTVYRAVGTIDGAVARAERGDGGFSYDAMFALPDGRTFAELSAEEKNRVSHRARAAAAIVAAVRTASCA
jgi:XTP/dITP diphosphohydrolase